LFFSSRRRHTMFSRDWSSDVCSSDLIEDLGSDVGDHPAGGDLLAALEPHAGHPGPIDEHLLHRALEADLDTQLATNLGHDLGNRAHAADRMAPGALLAVDIAEHVLEEHVGRARRVGAGVVADHRIEAERGLDRLALEPLAEKAGRRLGEQVEHVALLLEAEPGEPPALQRAVDERAPTLTD